MCVSLPDSRDTSGNLRRFTVDAAETLGIRAGSDQDVLHIDRTEAARYHLTDIGLPEASAGLLSSGLLVVAGEPDSRLTLTTTVGPLSRRQEDPVTLHATLRDDAAPITGAHVTARLAAPGLRPARRSPSSTTAGTTMARRTTAITRPS